MPKFPKTLLVRADTDNDLENPDYFGVRSADEFEDNYDGEKVAIYELVEIKRLRVTKVII